jgi:hypothetical protein
MHQKVQWRNYRKMTIQVLSISAMFFILYIPPIFLYVAYTFGLPFNNGLDYYTSGWYFAHNAMMSIPITFTISLSEFRAKFKIIFRCCCRRPARTANLAVINQTAAKT